MSDTKLKRNLEICSVFFSAAKHKLISTINKPRRAHNSTDLIVHIFENNLEEKITSGKIFGY